MVVGLAVAVGWTGEAVANRDALSHTQRVRSAGVIAAAAVGVADTVGQRGLLAEAGAGRVAHVVGLALALRLARLRDATDFVLAAARLGARIDAFLDAVDIRVADSGAGAVAVGGAPVAHLFGLTADFQVVGVAREAFLADARRTVVVSQAGSVGSALDARASVDAVAATVGHRNRIHLEADLGRGAIQVVAAGREKAALLSRIVAQVAGQTDAGSVAASGVRTADDSGTSVQVDGHPRR